MYTPIDTSVKNLKIVIYNLFTGRDQLKIHDNLLKYEFTK